MDIDTRADGLRQDERSPRCLLRTCRYLVERRWTRLAVDKEGRQDGFRRPQYRTSVREGRYPDRTPSTTTRAGCDSDYRRGARYQPEEAPRAAQGARLPKPRAIAYFLYDGPRQARPRRNRPLYSR